VEVALDGTVHIDKSAAAFEKMGCEITAKVPWYRQGVVSMWMPLDQAAKLARTPGVDSVKLSLKPRHYAGIVPGQGAKVLNALAAQANYNTLGTGIKGAAAAMSLIVPPWCSIVRTA
jgi:hypothetical protein